MKHVFLVTRVLQIIVVAVERCSMYSMCIFVPETLHSFNQCMPHAVCTGAPECVEPIDLI